MLYLIFEILSAGEDIQPTENQTMDMPHQEVTLLVIGYHKEEDMLRLVTDTDTEYSVPVSSIANLFSASPSADLDKTLLESMPFVCKAEVKGTIIEDLLITLQENTD